MAAASAFKVAERDGSRAERRAADVHDARARQHALVDVVLGDDPIRRRMAEEEEAALAVRADADEGDAGLGRAMHADAGDVHALGKEPIAHVRAERVGPDERHETDARAEPGQPDGDVGRRAAELAMEDVALGERHAGTLGEEVDQRFAERQDVQVTHGSAWR